MSEVAAACGCSRSYFTRMFFKDFGMTPMKFLNKARVEHATICLNSGLNVSETADKCGFKSIYHFSRFFKTNTGKNANEVRKDSLMKNLKEISAKADSDKKIRDRNFEKLLLDDRFSKKKLKECVSLVLRYRGKSVGSVQDKIKRILS
jgi:hypothetical protein